MSSRTTQVSNDGKWDPETAKRINECELSIITCGNSGVGKSFIDNVLLGLVVFVHLYKAQSVTRLTEVAFTTIRNRKTAVYNIPGLKELSKTNVELNKVQIEKAFEPLPVQVILSVFGVGDGGRIREEDLSTHFSIQAAFAVHNASTVFVINNVRPENFNTEYFTDTTVILKEVLDWPEGKPLPIVFLECLFGQVDIETDPRIHTFRVNLLEAINMACPCKHSKQGPINTSDDLVAEAAEKLVKVKKEMESVRAKYKEDIDTLAAKYEQQKAESAAMAERNAREMAQARANFESTMQSLRHTRPSFGGSMGAGPGGVSFTLNVQF